MPVRDHLFQVGSVKFLEIRDELKKLGYIKNDAITEAGNAILEENIDDEK